jgi:hypothetical protein
VFAFAPTDPARVIYHVYGFEQRKMYAQTIAHLLIGEDLDPVKPDGVIGAIGWPDVMVADLAGNGEAIIDELSNVYGIRIAAAEKKSKFSAIEVVNGDFVDARLKVLKGSSLEKQLSGLQWKIDEFGQMKENKGQANHSTDCLVYARRAIGSLISAGKIESAPVNVRVRKPAADADIAAQLEQGAGDGFDSLLGNSDYGDLVGDDWGL